MRATTRARSVARTLFVLVLGCGVSAGAQMRDLQKRLDKVARADQAALAAFALDDAAPEVRKAAVARLTDAQALKRVVEKWGAGGFPDDELVQAALARITDPAVLHEIVRSGPEHVRQYAVARIEDPGVLAAAAQDPLWAVRIAVVRRSDDQGLIERIALGDAHMQVREAAAEKLTHLPALAKVACADQEFRVRAAAQGGIRRLPVDERVRFAIESGDATAARCVAIAIEDAPNSAALLRQSPHAGVREVALGRVTDTPLLREIAQRDPEPMLRSLALAKTNDPALAALVYGTDKDPEVRASAAGRLTDRNLLVRVAAKDAHWKPRWVAFSRLAEPEIFVATSVRQLAAAMGVAPPSAADAAAIFRLALKDPSADVRVAALRQADPRDLPGVLRQDRSVEVRRAALSRTKDEADLLWVALNDADEENQRIAVRGLANSSAVLEVARKGKSAPARLAALERLEDPAMAAAIAAQDSAPAVRDRYAIPADTFRIYGRLLDANSGKPLTGWKVYVIVKRETVSAPGTFTTLSLPWSELDTTRSKIPRGAVTETGAFVIDVPNAAASGEQMLAFSQSTRSSPALDLHLPSPPIPVQPQAGSSIDLKVLSVVVH